MSYIFSTLLCHTSTLLYLRLISVIPIERGTRKTVITGLSNTFLHSNSKPLLAVVELLRMIVVIVVVEEVVGVLLAMVAVVVVVVVVVVVALMLVKVVVVRVKVELPVREQLIIVIT